MTKRLSQVFDLEDDSDESSGSESGNEMLAALAQPLDHQPAMNDAMSTLDKIDSALTEVRGLEASDNDMDEIAGIARESFDTLMDLGLQVDSRFASEIFSVASSMLGHALTAKTAKINKKLKMLDLQLKQAALQQKTLNRVEQAESIPLGEGSMLDRNELLKSILANKSTSIDK